MTPHAGALGKANPALRRRGAPRWLPWAGLAAMVFYAYGMAFIWGHYRFLDLRVYMGAAHELLVGSDPYNFHFTSVKLYATYPPFALAVLSPLSLVPLHLLVYLWAIANLACLGWLCKTALVEARVDAPAGLLRQEGLGRLRLACLLAFSCAITLQPVRADFGFGQVNIFLIAMVVADLLKMPSRARGALIGVASAIKFTPLVFVLLLAIGRDWRAVKRSILAFIAATAAAWAVAPAASDRYFLHFASMEQRIGAPSYVSNQSLNGIFTRLGLGGFSSAGTWFICSVAVVLLAALVARRLVAPGRSLLPALLVMATAGLLASPISWDHHWSWVALFPFAARDRDLPRPVRAGMWAVAAVAVLAPYWWSGTPTSYGLPTGPFGQVADDSLALAGLAFLGTWAWALRGELWWRERPGSEGGRLGGAPAGAFAGDAGRPVVSGSGGRLVAPGAGSEVVPCDRSLPGAPGAVGPAAPGGGASEAVAAAGGARAGGGQRQPGAKGAVRKPDLPGGRLWSARNSAR